MTRRAIGREFQCSFSCIPSFSKGFSFVIFALQKMQSGKVAPHGMPPASFRIFWILRMVTAKKFERFLCLFGNVPFCKCLIAFGVLWPGWRRQRGFGVSPVCKGLESRK